MKHHAQCVKVGRSGTVYHHNDLTNERPIQTCITSKVEVLGVMV